MVTVCNDKITSDGKDMDISNTVSEGQDVHSLKGKKKDRFLLDLKKTERGNKLRASEDWLGNSNLTGK